MHNTPSAELMGQTRRRYKPYPAYKDSGVEWLGEIPTHWKFGDTILNVRPIFHIRPRKIGMCPPNSGVFPDSKIVQALLAQLGWTHFSLFIYPDNPLKRDFCAEIFRIERWDTRTLATVAEMERTP